jgi:sugar (pentulose or hexulose) kinase
VNADLVLGIDCSTTASKAVAWDRDGVAVVEGRAPLSLITPQPGWGEQDARQWWEATVEAIAGVTKRVNSQRIAAICVTHQRETFVPVDTSVESPVWRRRFAHPDWASSVDDPVTAQASLAGGARARCGP